MKTAHAEARCSLWLFKYYFVEQGFSDNTHASFDTDADHIYSSTHASFIRRLLFFFLVQTLSLSFVVILILLCCTGSSPI